MAAPTSVPAARIQIWAASAGGCDLAQRQRPENDRDEQMDDRLPAAEVERHEDDDTEIERRVALAVRLQERDLGDDQRGDECEQVVGRARQVLVAADEQEAERTGGCSAGKHRRVEVSDGRSGREGEHSQRQKADRSTARGGEGSSLPGGQLNRMKPDALSQGESHTPLIGRKRLEI